VRRWVGYVLVALLLWLGGVTSAIILAGRQSSPADADAAIILGAAARGNLPSPVFEERIKHGLALYRAKRARVLILTGGYGEGARFAESQVAKNYLLKRGVPANAMLIEVRSGTTRQNLIEARRLMRAKKLQTALIVSDPLHMRRARTIARDLGIAAEPSPTPTSRYRSLRSKAEFAARELYFIHHYWLFGR
jgi:uncharacterized SAM-binding protein YcdF (DUF218 family)